MLKANTQKEKKKNLKGIQIIVQIILFKIFVFGIQGVQNFSRVT